MNTRTAAALRQPGLGEAWSGKERYTVKGLGLAAIPLLAGDEVQIVDPEGMQPASIVAFDAAGNERTAQLGLTPNGTGAPLAALLQRQTAGQRLRAGLTSLSITLDGCKPAVTMQGDTPAGHSIRFVSAADVTCLIAANGSDMDLQQPIPATELIVYVTRSRPGDGIRHQPPPPLADALQDFRIPAATAASYLVKAGEYIQVIDVDGRQCSDFQCFDLAMLDRGIERCLDATATRSLMASAYPGPGLHARFFDVELEPVVEVIQDTCGRHDSFGLACTSKYYDDLGYPGHVNCSDNFNRALQAYPVTPRKGWMAMNLFFNTFFDSAYQLYSDEPWSRPGDYVLFRALRDMVCVSSSCSDDVGAANAWNPTDMHLRVYPRSAQFQRAVAWRKTTDSAPVMTEPTGFHSESSQLTRNFVEYNGYWLANGYTNLGAIAEYWACRQQAALIDLSALRKYEVLGPDAELLLQRCVTRDMKKLASGQVVYTAMCNQSGGMIDDGTVFRLGPNNFRWIGGNDDAGLWLREKAAELGLRAWVKNATDQLHNLQLQGPNSRQILEQVIWTRPDQATVAELNWFRFSIARIGDQSGLPVLVSRTGYTGELGYEIFCHPRDAAAVWRALTAAGAAHGLKPMGLEALDMLRIEAGLIFAGHEFCEQTDPFEAGIPFVVPQVKDDDFCGRDALIRRRQSPRLRLTGLELHGREPAAHGDGVYHGRRKIGDITSATWSPILGKNIALCKLNCEFDALGTALEVGKLDGHQKRLPATVVPLPHFDPQKRRVRGDYAV